MSRSRSCDIAKRSRFRSDTGPTSECLCVWWGTARPSSPAPASAHNVRRLLCPMAYVHGDSANMTVVPLVLAYARFRPPHLACPCSSCECGRTASWYRSTSSPDLAVVAREPRQGRGCVSLVNYTWPRLGSIRRWEVAHARACSRGRP